MGTIYLKKSDEEQVSLLQPRSAFPIQGATSEQQVLPAPSAPASPPIIEAPGAPPVQEPVQDPIVMTPGSDDPQNHHFSVHGFPPQEEIDAMSKRGDATWIGKGSNASVYYVPGYGAVKYAFETEKPSGWSYPEEYDIAKKMGDLGVGPAVHGAEWSKGEKPFPTRIGMQYLHDHNTLFDHISPEGEVYEEEPEDAAAQDRKIHDIHVSLLKKAAAMHNSGISHNDIHTENIMVSSSGEASFIDFGTAKDGDYVQALLEAVDNHDPYGADIAEQGLTDMFNTGFKDNKELQSEIKETTAGFRDFYNEGGLTELMEQRGINDNEAAKLLTKAFYDKMFNLVKKHGYEV